MSGQIGPPVGRKTDPQSFFLSGQVIHNPLLPAPVPSFRVTNRACCREVKIPNQYGEVILWCLFM